MTHRDSSSHTRDHGTHEVTGTSSDNLAVSATDVDYLASAPSLVVAMDFDGTLAHFSDDPYDVRALPGALEALADIASLPDTVAMVISGRNLELLSAATQLDLTRAATAQAPGDGIIRLVGSHGAEAAESGGTELTDAQYSLLQRLTEAAQDFATRDNGMWVETKPFAVGLHTRAAQDATIAADAVSDFHAFASAQAGANITLGKDILEVAVTAATKGTYLEAFLSRPEFADSVVVFAGDDTTDETIMDILRPTRDIGIKVGPGNTAANRRVSTPDDVRDLLIELARTRAARI